MHAKKILFPTDFSTCSDAGLAHATALAVMLLAATWDLRVAT